MKDSRTAPRIFQQIDWSSGGDGIVVRDAIDSVARPQGQDDRLRAELPSQYYINILLLNAGVQPSAVKHKFTATAFEAAAAFVADKSIDACVSWAPDIYNIPEKVKGTRILSTTAEANKLIADVWAVRADFAKDHPEIVKGLVAGIFEGMDRRGKDPSPALEATLAEGYALPVEEVEKMAQRRPLDQLRREQGSSSSTPTTRPTSSAPGRTSPPSTASSGIIGSPVPLRRGDGLQRHPGAGRGEALPRPEGRAPRQASRRPTSRSSRPRRRSSPRPSTSTSTPTRPTSRSRQRDEMGKPVAGQALRPQRRRHARAGVPRWPASSQRARSPSSATPTRRRRARCRASRTCGRSRSTAPRR